MKTLKYILIIFLILVGTSFAAETIVDISSNTNLTAGDHITLTDDDLDIDDDFLLNDGDTGTGTYDMSGATIKQPQYPSFTFPGIATTTTATTTVALGTAFVSELWSYADCWVSSGTGAFNFNDGTNHMDGLSATTGVTTFTLTTNNTFTAHEKRYIDVGALTNAQISCTISKVVNN